MSLDFLHLSLYLAAAAAALALGRKDLRAAMGFTALCALPFAFTEPLFYPEYWRPRFLWDLGDRAGFGLEDFLFTAALGALSAGAYPAVFRRTLSPPRESWPRAAGRALALAAACGMAALALTAAGLNAIHACLAAMAGAGAWLLWWRADLRRSAAGGCLAVGLFYAVVLALTVATMAGTAREVWRWEGLMGLNAAGAPIEELLYGAACGGLGAVFYPWAADSRYADRRAR